jgi:hypothetical protein
MKANEIKIEYYVVNSAGSIMKICGTVEQALKVAGNKFRVRYSVTALELHNDARRAEAVGS